jgi:hypothetical protein
MEIDDMIAYEGLSDRNLGGMDLFGGRRDGIFA